jgi:hypothetical protein
MRWFRMRRSGLIRPFGSPVAAARALVGVQAQILPAAGLALWNRTQELTLARFEQLLATRRTLVKLWGQRNTLHVYASADWPLLHAARSLNTTWWERQVQADDAARAAHARLVAEVAELLRDRPTMGRSDLRAADLDLHEDLYSPWGGIFADLVRHGYACHAGRIGGEGHFAHRERWLPNLAWDPPSPLAANRTIAERYFAAYGPASYDDFFYWRAVKRADLRPMMAEFEQELAEVEIAGQRMWVRQEDLRALRRTPPEPEAWPVRLLYRFEPYLLAHRDKAWVVDPEHYARVWRPAGHIEGIVLAHGRGVGTWRYDRQGSGLAITVRPFAPLPAYVAGQIPDLAEQVAGFFSVPLSDLRQD